jgi:hypothetical protein
MTTVDTMPPEVALLRRGQAAARWRLDHTADPDRDRLWRAYRTGALRNIAQWPPAQHAAVRSALADAERVVPFPASGP